MKNVKKVLFGTMMAGAVALSAGMASGTFSDFQSTASSTGNKVETGNLSITSTGSETFSATNVAPGYSETKTFKLNNAGSLVAKDLTAVATVTVKSNGTDVAAADLVNYPDFKVTLGSQVVGLDGLKAAIENAVASAPDLAVGGNYTVPVKMELVRTTANQNAYQNLSVEVSVDVTAKAFQ